MILPIISWPPSTAMTNTDMGTEVHRLARLYAICLTGSQELPRLLQDGK